uniref:C2H2-type domain-containing protein n=1 Tax=Lates calcarifer TaxID=8187 RepID=A0A4W6FVH7_LATCA
RSPLSHLYREALQRHSGNGDSQETKTKGHFCPICVGRRFRGPNKLARHMRTHTKEKPFTCPVCALTFSQSYHMTRHVRNQHGLATNGECYTCPDCQKNFAFPEDLNKHLEIHVKENNGTCPKCNETFSSPEELETHMGVHEKSYTCNTCGKKFKVEYALKKHEQGHQNDQYYCSLCRKRFIKLSHYKRHIMVHDRRESRSLTESQHVHLDCFVGTHLLEATKCSFAKQQQPPQPEVVIHSVGLRIQAVKWFSCTENKGYQALELKHS